MAHANRTPSNTDVKLVRYDAARMALAEAHRVDEVKDIRDKAVAIAAYAKQANDTEMIEWATEIRVRAERRAGELLSVMEKAKGAAAGGKKESPRGSFVEQRGTAPTLEDLGIDRKQSSRWQKLAAVSSEKFEQAVEAAKEVAREVTTTHVLKLAASRDRATRTPSSTVDEFSESIFIARCVNTLRNAIADWPDNRPVGPLIQRLREHLDHQERRRGTT